MISIRPGILCVVCITATLCACQSAEPPAKTAQEPSGPWADAARRGATFRALGNEPFWNLEVHPDRLIMVTDLGERRTELPYQAVVTDGPGTTWRASEDGVELTAVIEDRSCADTMSGEEFEATATVTFVGEVLHGCGRFLTPP